jgi:hypothetical protein
MPKAAGCGRGMEGGQSSAGPGRSMTSLSPRLSTRSGEGLSLHLLLDPLKTPTTMAPATTQQRGLLGKGQPCPCKSPKTAPVT